MHNVRKIVQGHISVPSSSGKSLQRLLWMGQTKYGLNFSPLFIGEITSTQPCSIRFSQPTNFSPLFIGEITSTLNYFRFVFNHLVFQSPLHRGNHFNNSSYPNEPALTIFQSPLHRGNHFNIYEPKGREEARRNFSPLFIGEITSTS